MTKRNVFEGTYYAKSSRKTNPVGNPNQSHNNNKYNEKYKESETEPKKIVKTIKMYAEMAINYLYLPYNKTNYLAIMLVLVVLVFSLLLPDISQKLHKNSELKAIKNVLDHMQEEVKRAEVACLTANEEMGNLHHALCDEGTETSDFRRKKLATFPLTPAGDYFQHNLIREKWKKELDTIVDSSVSVQAHQKRKLPSCLSCTPTRSILKKGDDVVA
ncbi:uncharacterized protein LOC120629653 isoform X1 [Pararge aegeria]|uniref:uncharacterized protein LOC120629653 isoform X1 n=1 Tax=Pararge aegeria TaxID=116150 RepID=UPI0019D274AD|nr:uncharacterized protein LOC120629653 isoform X1 [Pararge aegeria]